MPKQTSSSRTKRPSGPYPQPPRTRSQTSAPMMNHSIRTAAPAPAPHARYHASPWLQTISSAHTMPSSPTGYSQSPRMVAQLAERTIPPSPTTPATPGQGGMQSNNNPSAPWSPGDDEILLQARAQAHGWNKIQRDHFPNKTSNACRKRFERLSAKRRGSDWNDERRDRVTHGYMQMREQMWRPLADSVGENWQDVERLCLDQGTKNLLPPLSQRDVRRDSDFGSRASHDSHEEDSRVRITNLIR